MPPSDHSVGAIKLWVWEVFGAQKVAHIFPRSGYRHDQAYMHAVALDEYIYALRWWAPIGVGWNITAHESRRHVEADWKHGPGSKCAQGGPRAVDVKQFQV